MKIPSHLQHKPVFTVENYDQVDGSYAGNTDARGLSVGLAQWNDRGRVDISAKVWRHTGDKWSRQSEELPLHRVLDLTILICEVQKAIREAYRFEKLYDPAAPTVSQIPLQGGAFNVAVDTANPVIDEDIQLFRDALIREEERLSERMRRLASVLRELGY